MTNSDLKYFITANGEDFVFKLLAKIFPLSPIDWRNDVINLLDSAHDSSVSDGSVAQNVVRFLYDSYKSALSIIDGFAPCSIDTPIPEECLSDAAKPIIHAIMLDFVGGCAGSKSKQIIDGYRDALRLLERFRKSQFMITVRKKVKCPPEKYQTIYDNPKASLDCGRISINKPCKSCITEPETCPTASLSVDKNTLASAPDKVSLTVNLSEASKSGTVVNFTIGGDAVDGIDYIMQALSFVVAKGSSSASLLIHGTAGLTAGRTIKIYLVDDANATISSNSMVAITTV